MPGDKLPAFEVGSLLRVSPRYGTAKMWLFDDFSSGPTCIVQDSLILLCVGYKHGWNHVVTSKGAVGWIASSVLERVG